MPPQAEYTAEFFQKQVSGGASASVVVRHIMDLFAPRSVVDVGCGVGIWLKAFMEIGVDRILGFDGEWVERSLLQIPEECFQVRDLESPLSAEEPFDLVLSLEVAEHLRPEVASDFVSSLTSLSTTVIFSAAIPYQGGTGHVNEQWPSFWVSEFNKLGYVARDWIRPLIWNNGDVAWCYAQNTLVFISSDVVSEREQQVRGKLQAWTPDLIDLVHPKNYQAQVDSVSCHGLRRILTRVARRLSKLFVSKDSSAESKYG